MSARNPILAAALCATLFCAITAPALADSLVFIKDGNVWLSEPDGTKLHQVTRDGSIDSPYRSPSQADDGTIVAAHFDEIVRMRQNGTVLNRIDPPGSQGTIFLDGPPIGTVISPDGSRIAYSYAQAACPPGASCGVRRVTLYSHADRFTPVAEFGAQRGVMRASWIDNGRTLLFGGALMQVNVDVVGGGDESFAHWFDDPDGDDLSDGELARQGDRLALVRGFGDNARVRVYRVSGTVGIGAPEAVCETAPSSVTSDPSWSPDGNALAFTGPGGIIVSTLPNFASATPCANSIDTLTIPGASQPDWGPAEPNPAPVNAPPATPASSPPPAAAPARPAAPRTTSLSKARAKCKKKRSATRRARCTRQAKRAAALKRCQRKTAKARTRCVRNAKRRYR